MGTTRKFTRPSGGFKVLARYGEPIPTRKDNERIVVQTVEAGSSRWVEARVEWLDTESGKWKGSKSAVCLSDEDAILNLADALTTAVEDAKANHGLFVDEPEANDDEDEIPVVKVVKARAAAFSTDALVPED